MEPGIPQRMVFNCGAVSVQCADGAIVHLDLEEGTLHKEAGSRPSQYLGVIQEGNEGRRHLLGPREEGQRQWFALSLLCILAYR